MTDNNRPATSVMRLIIEHAETALTLADQAGEPMLAAKLNDALICAIERRDANIREGGR